KRTQESHKTKPGKSVRMMMRQMHDLPHDRRIGVGPPERPARALAPETNIGIGASVWRMRIRPLDRGSGVLPGVCRGREMAAGADRVIGARRRSLPAVPERAERPWNPPSAVLAAEACARLGHPQSDPCPQATTVAATMDELTANGCVR